jgi:hypothetical protein
MKYAVCFFVSLFFIGCVSVPTDRLVCKDVWVLDSLEDQTIGTLLDGVEAKNLDEERFIAVVIHSTDFLTIRPARVLAWFRYAPSDQSVAIEYFSFPIYEKGNDLFAMVGRLVIDPELSEKHLQSMIRFGSFLRGIVQNKGIAGIENAKKIDVPLPMGLRNDALLSEMCKYTPLDGFSIREGTLYYWGIKTSKLETMNSSSRFSLYDHKINEQIESQILWPIQRAILERETPEDWREDYRKWQEEWPKIFREQQEIRKRHRQSQEPAERTE